MSTAYLIVAHGSREEEGNRAFFDLVERFRTRRKGCTVVGAFLDVTSPNIPEGIEQCVKTGAKEIFVIPLMFFPGRHVSRDIPRLIKEAGARHPGVTFRYGGALSEQPMLLDLLEEKARILRAIQDC